jgi:acyl carrier protein/acyl-CoA synthetase (AMP-forming)/AMP-acid ligase II
VVKDSDESKKVTQTCKRCGITDRYPNVNVNPDGICNICEFYTRNQQYIDNYFKTPEQLKQVIQEANKNKIGQYHCLLLFAGGRGAAYALYQLVDMGFKVLALTYDNGYFSKADLENIKKITASLGVEHVVLEHKHSDKILGESIKSAATVCRGCFHTSSSLAGEYAYKHDIPVVVGATLSRGQIIENKLLMFLQQGITGEKELENKISRFQRSAPLIDRAIFAHIDMTEIMAGTVYDKVKFVDFYRCFNISNRGMIAFLNQKDPYWLDRKTYAIYSTNCPIKQIGDFGHLREKGYHYYGGATSWEKRLGHLTLEELREDLNCKATAAGYESFLKRIGLQPAAPVETSDKYLCAYYVPGERSGTDGDLTAGLRDYLATRLPSYMVPNHFVQLDKIPLTSNGKVDKGALPEPRRTAAASSTYVAPKTDMEKIITDIWREVLKVDMVGVKDNFFDLGGSSLDVIMVGNQLKEAIQKDVPVVTLFTYPTVHSLARHLGQENSNPGKVEWQAQQLNKSQEKVKKTTAKIKQMRRPHAHE